MTEIYAHLPVLMLVWTGLMVGLISPGPSFFSIMDASISQRKQGVLVGLGCGFGTGFWAMITGFGLASFIKLFPQSLGMIQLMGGSYLLWLGYGALRKALSAKPVMPLHDANNVTGDNMIGGLFAFIKGLLIHLTNPKALLVWVSLSSVAVNDSTPLSVVWVMVGGAFLLSTLWHCSLAFIFSIKVMRTIFSRLGRWLSGLLSLIFFALGVRLLWGLIR